MALENLQVLWLLDNHFSGTIPTQLASLPYLTDIQLAHNNFSGTFPSIAFENSTSLDHLVMHDNPLLVGNVSSLCGTIKDIQVDSRMIVCSCCVCCGRT